MEWAAGILLVLLILSVGYGIREKRKTYQKIDRLLDCVVPKLILQPLVENAILHGLNARDSGTVYVYAYCEVQTLTIAVTDDGCGMPPEMVARINSPEPEILEGHLGLYNISSILKLYYGGAYGLRATSYTDVGTTVTIRLPARKEEPHA